jgi:AmmeMemoRadiSam system protein B/AmmeMemoRadiSam system protein A
MRVIKVLVIIFLGCCLGFTNGCASVGKQEPAVPQGSREQQEQIAELENLLSREQEQIDRLKKQVEVLEQGLKKLKEEASTLGIISFAEVRIKDRLLEIVVGDKAEIVVDIKPASAVPFVSFDVEDPNIATVEPLSASSSPQTLHISGIKQGQTRLIARVDKRLCTEVTIKIHRPSLATRFIGVLKSGLNTLIVFWKTHVSKPIAPVEEAAKPKKEEPAKLAKSVFRSTLAGSWYPANAGTLSKQIKGFFEKAETEPINNVIALILPHAGYQFSGQTAAFGLKTTSKQYKRVIVIGPSHRVFMEEVLSVLRATHYETPLGQIPFDIEFTNKLLKYPIFQNIPQANEYEHSTQIEVPLLQYMQKDFKLVLIVAGDCSKETIVKAGAILKSLVDEDTLVIASSDFTHFGPNYGFIPFRKNIPEQLKKLDMGAFERIKALDYKGFLEYRRKTGATICGFVPIAILLSMLDKSVEAKLVKYTTSGELTGNFSNSVSYLSIVFSGKWGKSSEVKQEVSIYELSKEDKKQLLALARKSLVYFLRNRKAPEASELNVTVSNAMKCQRAAFVTLKENSHLRGCIGDIFPRQPLYKSVISNAINAGVNDRRFHPVTEAECNNITIEISALTVPKPIASSDEIRIGIDGVVLSKSGYGAVFLPQVAPEQGWDVSQMLTQLSLKAGLPADAWKEGASFLVFQADVFGEHVP